MQHFSFSAVHRAVVSVLLPCGLAMLIGCGTGEYEKRLAGRDARLKAQAVARFADLGNEQNLASTNVSFRIPKKMTALSSGDQRRMNAGALPIPDAHQTYEGFVQDSTGGQLPYYCYVGVLPVPLQQITSQMQTVLTAAKLNGSLNWTDVQAESPDGEVSTWKKLRLQTNQDFYYKTKDGQSQYPNVPGMLEFYLRDAGKSVIFVIWRMPTSIEPNVELARLAPLVNGCVKAEKK
ncbi:MAG: hypothetical protein ABFC77_07470 [Thermoguttaceae bacterium]